MGTQQGGKWSGKNSVKKEYINIYYKNTSNNIKGSKKANFSEIKY